MRKEILLAAVMTIGIAPSVRSDSLDGSPIRRDGAGYPEVPLSRPAPRQIEVPPPQAPQPPAGESVIIPLQTLLAVQDLRERPRNWHDAAAEASSRVHVEALRSQLESRLSD